MFPSLLKTTHKFYEKSTKKLFQEKNTTVKNSSKTTFVFLKTLPMRTETLDIHKITRRN